MKVYLAGNSGMFEAYVVDLIKQYRPYILESFYYVDAAMIKRLTYPSDVILDSGAFTFMDGVLKHNKDTPLIDFEGYVERYADFINEHKIEKFFELDIDSIVGYDKVLDYRRKLERMTGRQCIPVYHSPRGIKEFCRMCDEYDYVSLGGIVGKQWKTSRECYMPWFIREAHRRGATIHGLGYTKLDKLKQFHFDSVDSTAWTAGNRFGFVYQFNDGRLDKIKVPAGKRISKEHARTVARHNFIEWVKYSRWAEVNL